MRDIEKIAFAVDTYLPPTYTWIHNLYKNIDNYDVVFFAAFIKDGDSVFPLKRSDSIFTCPGCIKRSGLLKKLFRRILRVLFYESGACSLYFIKIGRRLSIKLIHGHFAHVGWKYIIVSKALNVPLVVSFYGYDYDFLLHQHPRWKKKYTKLFRYASLILTEGEFGRANLISKGCNPEIIKVHHLGVEVDRIPFKKRVLSCGEILRMVQVASFYEKKGHAVLIETLRNLQIDGILEKVSITLVGNGPLKEKICEMVKRYGFGGNVMFYDHLPYEVIHNFLLEYHVFIHHSVTTADGDCEGGAPVVLLDAQATGMPVISTFHCDIPEEVINEKTGLLVHENDPAMFAAAIKRLIDNPGLITKLGCAAREHVSQKYCAKKQGKALTKLYDHLCPKNDSAKA